MPRKTMTGVTTSARVKVYRREAIATHAAGNTLDHGINNFTRLFQRIINRQNGG